MIGTNALNTEMGTLLVANAATLAPAMDANVIALVVAAFTPTPNTTVADLVLADSNGLDPIDGATGSQLVGIDPITGEVVMTIKPPAGGYIWISSGTFPPSITIYGFALLSNDLGTYLAGQLLASPLVVSTAGQVVDVGNPTISYPTGVTF